MNSLTHYGIKGMKWGIRRTPEQLGRRRSGKGSEDHQRSRELKNKGAKNLSTQELKELTNRLQLEQQYNRLNPNAIKKGENVAKGILAVAGTAGGLYALSKSPIVDNIRSVVDDRMLKLALIKVHGG